jgi:hypothetical protein
VVEERGLELPGRGLGVDAGREPEVVDRRLRPVAECCQRTL